MRKIHLSHPSKSNKTRCGLNAEKVLSVSESGTKKVTCEKCKLNLNWQMARRNRMTSKQ
jgi:hypothetical protein